MEDTKQRILEKSLELFSTKGYDAVSVGEIAKAVGIKAPSLYNHFPSKQAIFDAILETTSAHYQKVNCTPFVRQYGILFRKWGVFVCQRDNESTTELKR